MTARKRAAPSRRLGAPVKKKPAKGTTPKRPSLPPWLVTLTWTRAGGRCAFRGCNQPLWQDLLTNHEYNRGNVAHIVAAKPKGPRGHPTESPRLAKDPSNLFLLCPTHHKLIDDKKLEEVYPREFLEEMKREHERRILELTGITQDNRSVPLVLQVPVHQHADPVPMDDVPHAITRHGRYPETARRIDIDLLGMNARDHDESFWAEAREVIKATYEARIVALRNSGPFARFAVFSFGPIPLLIDFGRLIGNKVDADVFNLHRRPKGWVWPNDLPLGELTTSLPDVPQSTEDVALVISITSEVQVPAVRELLSNDVPLFEVRVDDPQLDSLRNVADLQRFIAAVERVMEGIHRCQAQRVHVFSAMPVVAAVEFGRALLPKLHASLRLYDFHQATKGWRFTFEILGAN